MCYVYILKCSDGSYYTGWTNDLDKRIQNHNLGKASKYTRGRLPVSYAFVYKCNDKIEATKLEWKIKQLNKSKKILLIETNDPTNLLEDINNP